MDPHAHGFHWRLFGALVVTFAVVGFFEYQVLAHDARELLIADERAELSADALGLAKAYTSISPGEVPQNAGNRYLRAMAARTEGEKPTLVDPSGYVVAAPNVLGLNAIDESAVVRRTLEGGRGYAGAEQGRAQGSLIFAAPVRIAGKRHVLVVRQPREALERRLGGLRGRILLLLLAGLVVAVPAFYVLGGRSLGRLHRAALDRATRDGLTDLGNQRAFKEEIERAMSAARRHGDALAVALIDIDDFKFENDNRGRSHGDRVLRAVAEVLAGGRAEDLAFRIGGDEFALLLPRTDDAAARVVAERAVTALARRPPEAVGISAGLATLGPDIADAETLSDQADAALREARSHGGGSVVSFREIEDVSRVVTVSKVRAVRRLLEEGRMDAAFQPIWDLAGGCVLAFEALARPPRDLGIAGPAEAFDVAIAIGRSPQLDEICRRAIFAEASRLPEGALLFVNVAPQTLDGEHLSGDSLVRLARAAGLEPERVVLEVTERFTGRVDRVVSEATRLRALGFKLALDDVGAGNSGLEMLRDLAVDFVKIDREVVARAVTDSASRAVLLSIATFARQTGAYVIAEGIEDARMLEFVRDPDPARGAPPAAQGVQGYLLGRPGQLAPEVYDAVIRGGVDLVVPKVGP